MKAIFSIVLLHDEEAYAAYSKGKKGKNLNYYFSQNSTMLQV